MEEEKIKLRLRHELGHYIPAAKLGYQPQIVINPHDKEAIFRTFIDPKEGISRLQQLEETAIISLGGYIAEEYYGNELKGIIGDLKDCFGIVKEIKQIQNKEFSYSHWTAMPFEVYEPYYNKCKQALDEYGGKEKLEEFVNIYLPQLKEKLGDVK